MAHHQKLKCIAFSESEIQKSFHHKATSKGLQAIKYTFNSENKHFLSMN